MKLTQKEREFIDTARVARMATVDAQGQPSNVPVCPLLDARKIYLGTEAGAKKVRNIRNNPTVAIVFDDYTEAWSRLCGIMIQGRARVVNRKEFRALRKKIYAKYLQYEPLAALEEGEAAILEIIPQKKFSWGLK
jgi:nitroimidazol reductase NimA-like FMN-containing flavoprotein (pyridoxamine 5'-phosphate oxidase superfamily)